MKQLDSGKITGLQFMFTIACFIQASSLLTAFFTPITRQDSWIVVLIGFALCLPFLWIFIRLMKRFPQNNLFQINELVFGKIGGKLVSVMYLWFLITLAALNLRDLGDFVQSTIMPQTPKMVTLVFFLAVCAWAVRNGIQVVTRYNTVFFLLTTGIFIFATLFAFKLFDINRFLPVFNMPWKIYVQGVHVIMTIPFGEIVAFLMIIPHIQVPVKAWGNYFFAGFALGGLTLLSVTMRDIAVLGNTLPFFTLPAFETLRMASFTQALSRLEILFAVVFIILLFSKVTFLYYVSALATAQLFRLSQFKPLVLSLGALIIFYSLLVYPSAMEHMASANQVVPFIWTWFEFGLPLLTLFVAKIRRLPQGKGGS